jgi:hypothetical protein
MFPTEECQAQVEQSGTRTCCHDVSKVCLETGYRSPSYTLWMKGRVVLDGISAASCTMQVHACTFAFLQEDQFRRDLHPLVTRLTTVRLDDFGFGT